MLSTIKLELLPHISYYIKNTHAFPKHLADIFQLPPSENEPEEEEALIQTLDAPYQLRQPIKHFQRAEVQEVISNLNPEISSDYDLITGKILKELPVLE
jgi:hypothetical protein